MIDYTTIPTGVKASIDRWLTHGQWPGENSFTRAVLENKLVEAVTRADDSSLEALASIATYVWEMLPAAAWGSHEKMVAWAARFKPGVTSVDRLLGPGDEVPL